MNRSKEALQSSRRLRTSGESGWSELPPELLVNIFSYLKDESDFGRCLLVCRRWMKVIKTFIDPDSKDDQVILIGPTSQISQGRYKWDTYHTEEINNYHPVYNRGCCALSCILISLLLITLSLLLTCGVKITEQWANSSEWKQTECLVLDSSIEESSCTNPDTLRTCYTLIFMVQYIYQTSDQVKYNATTDITYQSTLQSDAVNDEIDKYQTGQSYTCYYDSNAFSTVVWNLPHTEQTQWELLLLIITPFFGLSILAICFQWRFYFSNVQKNKDRDR